MYQAGPIGGGLTVGGILAATGSGSMMTVIGITILCLFALLGGLILLRAAAHRRDRAATETGTVTDGPTARHTQGGRHVG